MVLSFIFNFDGMNSEVKSFFKTLLLIVLELVCIDFTFGKIMDSVAERLPDAANETGRINYAVNKLVADCVILGSSRANHHYNTKILSDSLGMTVYNTGCDGAGVTYSNCMLHCILQRSVPKLVILELSKEMGVEDVKPSLNKLKMFYFKNQYVANVINEANEAFFPVVMRSNAFRYNPGGARIFRTFFCAPDSLDGYWPLSGCCNDKVMAEHGCRNTEIKDSHLKYFIDILEQSKKYNFKLIVVDSPGLYYDDNDCFKVRSLCHQYGAGYFDNYNLEGFVNHPELFKDADHLNSRGADLYTHFFVQQLKGILN